MNSLQRNMALAFIAGAMMSAPLTASRADALVGPGSAERAMSMQKVPHYSGGVHHRHGRGGWGGGYRSHRPMSTPSLWRLLGMLDLTEAQRREVGSAAAGLRERQRELYWKRREAAMASEQARG